MCSRHSLKQTLCHPSELALPKRLALYAESGWKNFRHLIRALDFAKLFFHNRLREKPPNALCKKCRH